jgi:predicted MFS family arabinose efflux permease
MIDRRLVLLAAGAFVVASDGTLIVGLLREIASSLAISPATAGQA